MCPSFPLQRAGFSLDNGFGLVGFSIFCKPRSSILGGNVSVSGVTCHVQTCVDDDFMPLSSISCRSFCCMRVRRIVNDEQALIPSQVRNGCWTHRL